MEDERSDREIGRLCEGEILRMGDFVKELVLRLRLRLRLRKEGNCRPQSQSKPRYSR